MKHIYLSILIFVLGLSTLRAQFPPLEMSADNVIGLTGNTVDVPIRAGTNWQNITTINGSIQFDTTVITWNSMSYWGLSFPQNVTFTYQGGGIVTWTWTSLITIGPTLSNGSIVFTLRFNCVGLPGNVSPVTFVNSPTPLYWANGFAWSGNNFTLSTGSVTLNCGAPTAAYTANDNLFTVNFTNQSSASVFGYLWDFGDGNTSVMQNPTHTYATGGLYTVCLTVTDSCGSDSSCQVINVCPTPTAAFASSGSELAYSFTDNSSASTTSWLWDFGDGNTSSMQNPSHTYAAPGTYTVCLTSTNACGSDSSCSTVSVTCTAPDAMFTDSIDGLGFFFTDQSTNSPTSWIWDFGDGNTSTMQNPSHTFAAPGLYNVCLYATSICGTDSFCVLETAICAQPEAGFTYATNMATVQFTDTSALSPTSWNGNFGDGTSSTMQNPTHTYAASGSYLVCLTATSICGSDSICDTVNIVIIGLEDAHAGGVRVYPNPSDGLAWVELADEERILGVKVIDFMGRSLMSVEGNSSHRIAVDMGEMARGIYFLQIEGENGKYVRRVVME